MTAEIIAAGSIRRRLSIQLLDRAALLPLILIFIVRSFAEQLAGQSQDNIHTSSATSILEASAVQQGEVSNDIPYATFSMLSNPSDDQVFNVLIKKMIFSLGMPICQRLHK